MAILKNTTISGTANLQIFPSLTASRPGITTTIIQWTNTGSQAYTVLAGNTPTLTNTTWTAPTGVNQIEVLVVAGGGSGSNAAFAGGGGGAGGLIYNSAFAVTPGTSYTVTIGAGGPAGASAAQGSNSVFATLTAIGGGLGAGSFSAPPSSANGGSGGGSGINSAAAVYVGGSGTANQGFSGGGFSGSYSAPFQGASGGGAGAPGANSTSGIGGGGGNGLNFAISGTSTWYAGGGGAGSYTSVTLACPGGLGGGGKGEIGNGSGGSSTAATAGTASTGGGGGGTGSNGAGLAGAGGSGIVIIRYAVTSTSADPRGLLVYNSNSQNFDLFENTTKTWVSKDPTRNFGGHNLLTYSGDFTNAVWTPQRATGTASATQAPDGTLTGYKLSEDSTTGFHYTYETLPALTSGITYTASCYVKAAERSIFYFDISQGIAGVYFNLSTQTISNATSGYTGTMISVGNGWYRCMVTFVANASGTWWFQPATAITAGTYSFAGTTGSGLYLWGPQFEIAPAASPYVKTLSSNSPVPTSIGGYQTHTYITTGTSGFSPAYSGPVEVLVVAGGGSGSDATTGGGGGAGGLIYSNNYWVNAGQQYSVVVGAGGAVVSNAIGNQGGNSQFGVLIAIGGGTGGPYGNPTGGTGGQGGSGGGGGFSQSSGNGQPGVSVIGQGFIGGVGATGGAQNGSGGGGGAGGTGGNAGTTGGNGGIGLQFSISGTAQYYAGGGGGGSESYSGTVPALGGYGGGGNGSYRTSSSAGVSATSGLANSGGGGGGSSNYSHPSAGSGGSGIVIVRYKCD